MLNFPVANGTSGHLLGGVLAAVLVGPYAGALAVTVVLVVQALLFADGGLSALGLNVVNMALVGAFAGYGIFLAGCAGARHRRRRVTPAAGLAAFTAPVLAAVAFIVEYAIGGNDAVSVGSVAGGDDRRPRADRHRRGDHHRPRRRLVMAMRPDLVYGARASRRRPARRSPAGPADVAGCAVDLARSRSSPSASPSPCALVVFVAPCANSEPRRAREGRRRQGHRRRRAGHALADSPLADYGVEGVDNADARHRASPASSASRPRSSSAPALVWIVRRRRNPAGAAGDAAPPADADDGRSPPPPRAASRGAAAPPRRRSASCWRRVLFVFAVVATPKEQFWAFGVARRPHRARRA